jgi:BON domain
MQAVLAERPSTSTSERTELSTLARQHLENHPHFRGRLAGLRIEQRGKTLFLKGRLPTFYLKQLVQEAVRYLPGVQTIRNEIDVVSPYGISSVRP